MNKTAGPSENTHLLIERREHARIVRSALDEVKAIQTLLSDVYKDVGDGRTLVRELVQNADDAGAERLVFTVLEAGWPDAKNSLLRGPALVVANNGSFLKKDHEGFHQALGGAKAEEAGKIGRFGIGLKSVFHVCEAIVYLGADNGTLRPGALNPWAGTGPSGDADPLHPDWDNVADDDLQRLLGVANSLIGEFQNGLLQWIPIRLPVHLDRQEDGQYGLGKVCPNPEGVAAWFGRPESLALLLAQCGHLVSIEGSRARNPFELDSRQQLSFVVRPEFGPPGWIGRYEEDPVTVPRSFHGQIEAGSRTWSIVGVEALGHDGLRRLRETSDWPKEPYWRDGRCVWVPRKAMAHSAVTILYSNKCSANTHGARIRWAVFLPLDDDPTPQRSAIVEPVGQTSESGAWDIILHGYFWPSHDRRSIPGVTDSDPGAGESKIRAIWNRAVRDELLLPLLPQALATALQEVDENAARTVLDALASSKIVRTHLRSVTRYHLLLPVVSEGGVQWRASSSEGLTILSIPGWSNAPSVIRKRFIMDLNERAADVIFIDQDAPKLGGDLSEWPHERIKFLLDCVPSEVLDTPETLSWTERLLKHVLGSPPDARDSRSAVAANWLSSRIGEDALGPTTKGTKTEERSELRSRWLSLFAALPKEWLVSTPLSAQRAVAQLARDGSFGAGILPIPMGRDREIDQLSCPDAQLLDGALMKIGTLLQAGEEMSQPMRLSFLMLSESLLSVRGAESLDGQLSAVPLLRALQLPNDKDEAWSVSDLQDRRDEHRVFARLADEVADESTLEAPSDPKKAVTELSESLGLNVWLVDGAVASAAGVPVPAAEELALTVLSVGEIQTRPQARLGILKRLAGSEDVNPVVERAIIALMTGHVLSLERDYELYYVRSQDTERDANQKTLGILLGLLGKPWCSTDACLVEPLQHALVDKLRIKAVDFGVLHKLLEECLDDTVDWSKIGKEEAIHLLHQLHGNTSEARFRWWQMPLHRAVGEKRRNCDEHARRVSGDLMLPPGLKSEIWLLDPDPPLAHLYLDVPELNEEGVLRAILTSERPWEFFEWVVCALITDAGGPILLPHNNELLALLGSADWLPSRDGSSGISPQTLLVLPDGLRASVLPLARAGALGKYVLVEEVKPAAWVNAEAVIHEILGHPGAARQVQRLRSALDRATIANMDDGAYLLLPDERSIDAQLVEHGLQSTLVDSHPGWALVRDACSAAGIQPGTPIIQSPAAARDAVLGIARALCAPLPAARQVWALTTLGTARPGQDSPSGRLFQGLVKAFAQTDVFFTHVLPRIELPTQQGQWREAGKIAISETGVARCHRLISDLRAPLGLTLDNPIQLQQTGGRRIDAESAGILAEYFSPWLNRLQNGAVGAFLALLGDGHGDSILNLSQRWLGEDVSVEGMRLGLDPKNQRDLCAHARIFIADRIASGQRVEALNLLRAQVEMEAGTDNDMIFATDPVCQSSSYGNFWKIFLRDVQPETKTSHDLVAVLGNTAEWWAVRVLRIEREVVRSWWARWGGSTPQVGPVRASILAHLPLTLHQLDVRECPALKNALQEAQRVQRRREQAPPAQITEAFKNERTTLNNLASLIQEHEEHQRFIWNRVQELIKRYGYNEDSVLLELAQNADDALAQAHEISGQELPPKARQLIVRVMPHETIDVIHYGRPINETGGAAFSPGRDRQWDQDLYFMMLLNLSGKPGETPGESKPNSTTGRFGLGFKTVHLVSQKPSVVSGFLAFDIAAGLLPCEQPVPKDPDLQPVDGNMATRIRLPLREDKDSAELTQKMFHRFDCARAILPAFAREIREVVVEGGAYAGASRFDGEPIDGAPGWSLGRETVSLPGAAQWRLLRFRPADAEPTAGTEALIIGLRLGVPEPFPSDMPFLWNVTPTSEGWGCGYAVNGPFKLDPGRTHVSLEDIGTLRVAASLGEALGRGLVELQDALVAGGSCTSAELPSGEEAVRFLASIWRILAAGIDNVDTLRKRFLLCLHGDGRGLSGWMSERPVVPSGLPAPFPSCLPTLHADTQIEVAMGGLDNPSLCRTMGQIADLAVMAKKHRLVSGEVAKGLKPLLGIPPRQLWPEHLLQELAEYWDHRLTPERLHMLRPFAAEPAWNATLDGPQGKPWFSRLVARSAAGDFVPLRKLLLTRAHIPAEVDATVEDELLRADFASDERVLDPAYILSAEDLKVFQRLRGRHEIDAAVMASWYYVLPVEQHPAALRYLMDGRLQNEVLEILLSEDERPHWLRGYEGIREMLDDLDVDQWRRLALLASLFPDRFQPPQEPRVIPVLERRSFFERLKEWWDDQNERCIVIESYEGKAWPDFLRREGIAAGLLANSFDHWLGLLVLGACRSLGRAQPGHHRAFLESVHREGWWEVFKNPDRIEAWMEMLRLWQDTAVANLTYPRWMSLFPAIYQLSRYLEKYKRLLRSAGRRPSDLYRVTCLLAPRIDEALTGAGHHFDAPPAPLDMGLHWALRELVRMGVTDGTHLFPDCWVPSEQLLRFLRPLGLAKLETHASNPEKAKGIFDFLATELDTEAPHLHRAFDIPLLYVDANPELQERLGLED